MPKLLCIGGLNDGQMIDCPKNQSRVNVTSEPPDIPPVDSGEVIADEPIYVNQTYRKEILVFHGSKGEGKVEILIDVSKTLHDAVVMLLRGYVGQTVLF